MEDMMTKIIETESGTKYMMENGHITRISEVPLFPMTGTARVGEPIIGAKILDISEPFVGQKLTVRFEWPDGEVGTLQTSRITEIRYTPEP